MADDAKLAHDDSVLMAQLASANNRMARFIVRHMDADAGRTTPADFDEHNGLADVLAEAATALRQRAELIEALRIQRVVRDQVEEQGLRPPATEPTPLTESEPLAICAR